MNPTHYLSGRLWMIHAPALDAMKAVAVATPVPQASMGDAYDRAWSFPTTQLGSTAVIPIHGPIHGDETYAAATMAFLFGGVGQGEILKALKAAMDDESIDSIILDIDSPGGVVTGTGELAATIRQANGVKPITAYVSGNGCSAAYYLAAACGRIVCNATAMLGSIGTVACFVDDTEAMKKAGLKDIEIVSTQSPHKRPDPATPAGKAAYQAIVDEVTHIFIADVAKYRNVSEAKVLSDFGGGGVLIGAEAVKVGMADAVGSLQSCLADIRQTRGATSPGLASSSTMTQGETPVDWKQLFNFARTADPAALEAAAAALDGETVETKLETPVAVNHGSKAPDIAAYEARIAEAERKAVEALNHATASQNTAVLATIEKDVLAFTNTLKADAKAVPAVAEKLAAAFKASLHAEHKLAMPEGVASLSAAIQALADALPANPSGVAAISSLPAGSVIVNQETNKTVTAESIDALWEKHYANK